MGNFATWGGRERVTFDKIKTWYNIGKKTRMKIITHLFLSTLAVMIAAYLIPGVAVPNFWVALVVAMVLGILNIFVKPVIVILTLPINILTLGLFTLVINTAMVLLAAAVVPQFYVRSPWAAFIFSLVLWIVNGLFHWIEKKENI